MSNHESNMLSDTKIGNLEPFYNARLLHDEDVILATIDFFRQEHHAYFVKVVQDENSIWTATKDPYDRLEGIYHLDDTALIPVKLPNMDGDWMLVIHPWGE